jgi:hypothetical protein
VLFDLQPHEWNTCILHMNLRIVGVFEVKGIIDNIRNEEQVDVLVKLWTDPRCGFYVSRSELTKKKIRWTSMGLEDSVSVGKMRRG